MNTQQFKNYQIWSNMTKISRDNPERFKTTKFDEKEQPNKPIQNRTRAIIKKWPTTKKILVQFFRSCTSCFIFTLPSLQPLPFSSASQVECSGTLIFLALYLNPTLCLKLLLHTPYNFEHFVIRSIRSIFKILQVALHTAYIARHTSGWTSKETDTWL